MTLDQLQELLVEQKRLTIEYLEGHNYQYNADSTDSQYKTLNIDREKMREVGMRSRFPDQFMTLKAFLPE